VSQLSPPLPLELMAFGLDSILRSLPDVAVRPGPSSPDGGVLADYHGAVEVALGDLAQLAARFAATPGVVEHGLFPPSMVSLVVVGRGDGVETLPPAG